MNYNNRQLYRVYATLTTKCNLKCKYCYLDENKSKELTTSEWKQIFEKISKYGVQWVQLTGGEPLLREDLLEILKTCNKKFNKVILATNAILINRTISRKLSKFKNIFLYISLNSIQDINSKKNIIENLIKDKNKIIGITTVTKNNFSDIPRIIDFVKKKHIKWNVGFLNLTGHAKKEMLDPLTIQYIEELKNLTNKNFNIEPLCKAGFSTFSIMENGDVTPCVIAREKKFIGGNILRDDFEEIFSSKAFKKWRAEICLTNEICKTCDMLDECQGGCPMRRLLFYNVLKKDIFLDISACAWKHSLGNLGLNKKNEEFN
jgi:radical SAM protein with 4Fe4S-binding SPASM domain